jgi:methyl-accepting chemotaxis protein
MNWLGHLSIKKKLHLLVFLSALVVVVIAGYGLIEQRTGAISERKLKVESQVEQVMSLVRFYYDQRTELGDEQARQQAMGAIKALRYDGKNYFWITNPTLTVLMHPIKAKLNGKDASGFKDGGGKFHWQEMARISRSSGSGFLDYTWRSPDGELLDKISYVAYFAEWDWIIGSGILIADINQSFVDNIMRTAIAIILGSALLALFSFIIGRNIVLPIEYLRNKVHNIADGDLTIRFNTKRRDEIGKISNDMNGMLEKLQSALKLARDSSHQSMDLVNNIASSSEQTAQAVLAQHNQLDMLATAMDEMNSTNMEVSRNAEETAVKTNAVATQANTSSNDMESTVGKILDTDQQMATAASLVDELNQGVIGIANVITIIQGISEQTNLLALNAAIEAARAGEHGRGFAVVADEVRSLASSTNSSTDQIQQSINLLTENAEKAAHAVATSRNKVQECVQSSDQTRVELGNMVNTLGSANDMVTQIASASEEQGAVSNEINENLNIINLSANEVNEAANHLAQQSQILVENCHQLESSLSYFKVS